MWFENIRAIQMSWFIKSYYLCLEKDAQSWLLYTHLNLCRFKVAGGGSKKVCNAHMKVISKCEWRLFMEWNSKGPFWSYGNWNFEKVGHFLINFGRFYAKDMTRFEVREYQNGTLAIYLWKKSEGLNFLWIWTYYIPLEKKLDLPL